MKPRAAKTVDHGKVDVSIPPDGMSQQPGLGSDEKTVRGLMAIGANHQEAIQACAQRDMEPACEIQRAAIKRAIALSALIPKWPERMDALRVAYAVTGNGELFGFECLKAGINPVCVALSAIKDRTQDGFSTADLLEARRLIASFGVDAWLAERLKVGIGDLVFEPGDVERVSAPIPYIPCSVTFSREIGDVEIPWLEEVASFLNVSFVENLSFPALRRVGGLDAMGSTDLKLPMLEEVTMEMDEMGATDLYVPKLKRVDGDTYSRWEP